MVLWTDEQLRWDPNEYGGIERLSVPTERVWTPSFALSNCAKMDILPSPVWVYSNGTVVWLAEKLFESFCSQSSTVEEHNCVIVVQTSAVDVSEVTFKLLSNINSNVNLKDNNRKWSLTDVSIKLILSKESISGLYFHNLIYSFKIKNQMIHSGCHSFRDLLNPVVSCLCLFVFIKT